MGAKRLRAHVVLAAVWIGAFATPVVGREAIVGGTPASGSSWPFIVALVDPAAPSVYEGQFCSGVLVDPSWVLTAAHCVLDENGTPIALSQVETIAGITDLNNTTAGQRRTITEIVDHPVADAALLRLSSPIEPQANPPITPIDIATELEEALWAPGAPVQIAGWGSTTAAEPYAFPSILFEAGLSRVADPTCAAVVPDFNATYELCADSPALGFDACVGDSGGPMTVADSTGRRLLVGLVSFGPTPCGAGPTGFTRLVPDVRDWVSAVLGLVSPPAAVTNFRAEESRDKPYTTTLRWTPPATTGPDPFLGYMLQLTPSSPGQPSRVIALPASDTITITDLRTPALGWVVAGIYPRNRAGLGPRSPITVRTLLPSAQFTKAPSIPGVPKVGQRLRADTGAWVFPDPPVPASAFPAILFERCPPPGGPCVSIPNSDGPFIKVPREGVGQRLRVTVVLGGTDLIRSSSSSGLSQIVPPTISGRLISRSSQRARVSIGARLETQPGATIVVQLLDHRGKRIALDRESSTIDGRRPKLLPGGRKLRGKASSTQTPGMKIVTATRRTGPLRKGVLVVSASLNGSAQTETRISVKIPS